VIFFFFLHYRFLFFRYLIKQKIKVSFCWIFFYFFRF